MDPGMRRGDKQAGRVKDKGLRDKQEGGVKDEKIVATKEKRRIGVTEVADLLPLHQNFSLRSFLVEVTEKLVLA